LKSESATYILLLIVQIRMPVVDPFTPPFPTIEFSYIIAAYDHDYQTQKNNNRIYIN